MKLRTSRHSGFTLVEMLAAMTVLGLILGMLSEISSHTVLATQASHKQMAATQQARSILDVLRGDLDNLVAQNEASTLFVKTDGTNPELVFITRSRGPQGATDFRFMAVAYSLNGNQMLRKISPVSWSNTDLMAAAFSAFSSTDSNILADGILRFEITAHLDNGDVVPLSASGLWKTSSWNQEAVPNGFYALDLSKSPQGSSQPRVRSLTVAIAAVNQQGLSPTLASQLAANLPAATTGLTPTEMWYGVLDQGGLKSFSRHDTEALSILQITIPLK